MTTDTSNYKAEFTNGTYSHNDYMIIAETTDKTVRLALKPMHNTDGASFMISYRLRAIVAPEAKLPDINHGGIQGYMELKTAGIPWQNTDDKRLSVVIPAQTEVTDDLVESVEAFIKGTMTESIQDMVKGHTWLVDPATLQDYIRDTVLPAAHSLLGKNTYQPSYVTNKTDKPAATVTKLNIPPKEEGVDIELPENTDNDKG